MMYFDLESTGPDPVTDRIIQFSFLADTEEWTELVNPGIPIPANIAALTGITDADVATAKPFADFAQLVSDSISGQPLVGFGCIGFDIPLLAEEFERAGVDYAFGPVIDTGTLFKLHHPRSLADAVRTYLGREFPEAHRSDADARMTRRVFRAQLAQFEGLDGLTPERIAEISNHGRGLVDPAGKLTRIDGAVCFNTHRNRGVPVGDDIGYAEWMLRSDFPAATKRAIRAELDRLAAIERVASQIEELRTGSQQGEIPWE